MTKTERFIMSKTVLIVEDDPIVRMMAEEMFIASGFDVESTDRAERAVDVIAQSAKETLFLFTDVQSPGSIDGVELARIVKRRWPHIQLLVTSAYEIPMERLPEGVRFAPKPWSSKNVLGWARSALSS